MIYETIDTLLNIFKYNINRRILIALIPPPPPTAPPIRLCSLARGSSSARRPDRRLQKSQHRATVCSRAPPPCATASRGGMVDCPRLLLPPPRVAAAQYTRCAAGCWSNPGRAPFSVSFSHLRRWWSYASGEFISYVRAVKHSFVIYLQPMNRTF